MSASHLSGKTVLILGHVFPEPQSSAAGMRMLQLIDFFLQRRLNVVFACDSLPGPHAVLPQQNLFSVRQIQVNDSSFDEFLLELNPDIVMFDRFMTEEKYGWRVTATLPEALQMLDMEDFHALRKARESTKTISLPPISAFQQDFAWREIASILRCDLVLVISEFELKLLKDLFNIPESSLLLLPFWTDPPQDRQVFPEWEHRKHFVTIGNFLHPPNVDSVLWLRQEIWPEIRQQIPDAQLHVYGAYQNDKQSKWHDPQNGFLMKGRAEDALQVMLDARVCLAPLRFGAGLKGKLLMAMMAKTPSVTTQIGAEGMHGDAAWPGFVANTAKELAHEAVQLYQSKDKWRKASEQAQQVLLEKFNPQTIQDSFHTRLEDHLLHLKKYRSQHFYQGLFNHSTLQSYKYMSRWIELKNKN